MLDDLFSELEDELLDLESDETESALPRSLLGYCRDTRVIFDGVLYRIDTGVVVHQNKAYRLGGTEDPEAFCKFQKRIFPLKRLEKISRLEQQYIQSNYAAIEAFKYGFLRGLFPDLRGELSKLDAEYSRACEEKDKIVVDLQRDKLRYFFAMNIRPIWKDYSTLNEDGLERVLSADSAAGAQATKEDADADLFLLSEETRIKIANVTRELEYLRSDAAEAGKSILDRFVLRGANVFINGNYVYHLDRVENSKRQEILFQIADKQFTLTPFDSLQALEQIYLRHFESRFKLDALEGADGKQSMMEQLKQRAQLNQHLKKIEQERINALDVKPGQNSEDWYDGVLDIGFLQDGASAYIYTKTGEYMLTDNKTNQKYKFQSCRVAVPIELKDERIQRNKAIILDAYTHPFLWSENVARQDICLDDFYTPGGKGEKLNSLPAEKAILGLLIVARNTVQEGYFPGCNPRRPLSNPCFKSNEVQS